MRNVLSAEKRESQPVLIDDTPPSLSLLNDSSIRTWALALLGREDVSHPIERTVQSVFVLPSWIRARFSSRFHPSFRRIAISSAGSATPSNRSTASAAHPELTPDAPRMSAQRRGRTRDIAQELCTGSGLVAFFNRRLRTTFERAGLPSRAVAIDEVDRKRLGFTVDATGVWRLSGRTNAQALRRDRAGVAAAIASTATGSSPIAAPPRALGPGDIACAAATMPRAQVARHR